MAVEKRRGCGFRKIHGMYLVADGIWVACDRLPYEVAPCPTCGGGIHFPLNPRTINPQKLFGEHENCSDKFKPCHMCQPTEEIAFVMGVGKGFYKTPNDFLTEAIAMGVSKRVSFIPKKMEFGKTVIYLIHPKAIYKGKDDEGKDQYQMGIFTAFVPKAVEKLFWESERNKKLEEKLEKQGITPIWIPDGDKDHMGSVYVKGTKRGRPRKNQVGESKKKGGVDAWEKVKS